MHYEKNRPSRSLTLRDGFFEIEESIAGSIRVLYTLASTRYLRFLLERVCA